eukprot:GHVT01067988.1.p1 GENE.GHVT01067988.1~~GHVT01067988.1.p1  ORF type:complete len:196 (-),score=2.24 GHVT01067988.1:161-688(-)
MTEIVTLRAIFLSYYCLHADNQDLRDALGRIVAVFFERGTSLRFLDNGFYSYHVFAWRTSSRTLRGPDLFAYGNCRPERGKIYRSEAYWLIAADARPYCWGGFDVSRYLVTAANRLGLTCPPPRVTCPLADRSAPASETNCDRAIAVMAEMTREERVAAQLEDEYACTPIATPFY